MKLQILGMVPKYFIKNQFWCKLECLEDSKIEIGRTCGCKGVPESTGDFKQITKNINISKSGKLVGSGEVQDVSQSICQF
jgi:hypothetical protein